MAARVRKAGVQPAECRIIANGTTLKSWPSWPGHAGQLGQQRHAGGANQSGQEPDDGDECHGVARPTRIRPSTPPGMLVGKGQLELAEPHQQATAGNHGAGTEPVHQYAHRNLQAPRTRGVAAR